MSDVTADVDDVDIDELMDRLDRSLRMPEPGETSGHDYDSDCWCRFCRVRAWTISENIKRSGQVVDPNAPVIHVTREQYDKIRNTLYGPTRASDETIIATCREMFPELSDWTGGNLTFVADIHETKSTT